MNDSHVEVVTSFVLQNNKILLLRRSENVGSYRGYWAGVSGYLEGNEPDFQARVELKEELGLEDEMLLLERAGTPVNVNDENGRNWLVYPFCFSLRHGAKIRLDWEHVEMRWISPSNIEKFHTVPGLAEVWKSLSVGQTS